MSEGGSPAGHRGGYGWVLLAVLLFSTIEVVSKWMSPLRPPLQLAFLRFFIAGLVLLPFAIAGLRRRGVKPGRKDAAIFAGLGLIGVTCAIGAFHTAIAFLPANQAAILFSGNPVFVAILAPAVLGERLDRRRLGALLLGLAGTAAFLWDRGHLSIRAASGVVFMLGAMFAFALFTILSKKVTPRYGAIAIVSLASLAGSLALLPMTWLHDGCPFRVMTAPHWAAIAYLALVATAAAYAAWFHGLRHLEASHATLLFFVKPVAASALAWVVLGERLGWLSAVGAAMILAATAVALRRSPAAEPAVAPD